MLTDDDLTRELGAAFRAESGDLTYGGRRRPRRTAAVALPVAAVGLAIAAVAVNGVLADDPAPVVGGPAVVTTSPTATAGTVTEELSLAGFTVKVEHAAGVENPVVATMVATLPDDVTEVPLTGTEAKAWVGKDPETGDNAIYVKAPTRNDGRLFALMSSTWTQDELVDLLKNGHERTVPLVER